MNTIYIGVDFHARKQTICYLTTEGGEILHWAEFNYNLCSWEGYASSNLTQL